MLGLKLLLGDVGCAQLPWVFVIFVAKREGFAISAPGRPRGQPGTRCLEGRADVEKKGRPDARARKVYARQQYENLSVM